MTPVLGVETVICWLLSGLFEFFLVVLVALNRILTHQLILDNRGNGCSCRVGVTRYLVPVCRLELDLSAGNVAIKP